MDRDNVHQLFPSQEDRAHQERMDAEHDLVMTHIAEGENELSGEKVVSVYGLNQQIQRRQQVRAVEDSTQ